MCLNHKHLHFVGSVNIIRELNRVLTDNNIPLWVVKPTPSGQNISMVRYKYVPTSYLGSKGKAPEVELEYSSLVTGGWRGFAKYKLVNDE